MYYYTVVSYFTSIDHCTGIITVPLPMIADEITTFLLIIDTGSKPAAVAILKSLLKFIITQCNMYFSNRFYISPRFIVADYPGMP